jgi:hypothetical protein
MIRRCRPNLLFFILASLAVVPPTRGNSPPASQPAPARPDAPDGFKWHEIKPIKAAFLRPDGWHFSKATNKHGVAYKFTKEDTSKGKSFLTGLTINVTKKVTEKSHVKPSLYAVHFMQEYTKGLKVTLDGKLDHIGILQRLIFEVVKKIPETDTDQDFRVRVVVIANDKTDTMYTIFFGAPNDEWEQAWKIGNVLLSMFMLDDDV